MAETYPNDLLQVAVDRFWSSELAIWCLPQGQSLNITKTKNVCNLIPRIKVLHIQASWDPASFLHFIKELNKNPRSEKIIELRLPNLDHRSFGFEILWRFEMALTKLPLATIIRIKTDRQSLKMEKLWVQGPCLSKNARQWCCFLQGFLSSLTCSWKFPGPGHWKIFTCTSVLALAQRSSLQFYGDRLTCSIWTSILMLAISTPSLKHWRPTGNSYPFISSIDFVRIVPLIKNIGRDSRGVQVRFRSDLKSFKTTALL